MLTQVQTASDKLSSQPRCGAPRVGVIAILNSISAVGSGNADRRPVLNLSRVHGSHGSVLELRQCREPKTVWSIRPKTCYLSCLAGQTCSALKSGAEIRCGAVKVLCVLIRYRYSGGTRGRGGRQHWRPNVLPMYSYTATVKRLAKWLDCAP